MSSGLTGTGGLGTFSPNVTIGLNGIELDGNLGNLGGPPGGAGLIGQEVTGALGTLLPNITIGATGIVTTIHISNELHTLTGVSGAGQLGTLTPGITVSLDADLTILTGVQAVSALGSLGKILSIGLSGVSGSPTQGSLIATLAHMLSGLSGLGQLGIFTIPQTILEATPIRSGKRRPGLAHPKEEIESLIQGLQLTYPRLYQILMELNNQLGDVTNLLSPIVAQFAAPKTTQLAEFPVTDFQAKSIGSAVRLTWNETSDNIFTYEIREEAEDFRPDTWIDSTTLSAPVPWVEINTLDAEVLWESLVLLDDWDFANFVVRTSGLSATIEPLLYGPHVFLLKTISGDGTYSTDLAKANITVPTIPGVVITKSVIDNNVLLYWTEPVSLFDIDVYRVYKDSVLIASIASTFTSFFEVVAGTYVYSIKAVDIAGNVGEETFIEVLVSTPPDYVLQDSRVSDLSGTKTNTILLSGPKLLCNWAAETFEHHFTSRSWLTPKNQIQAGYPIYIQPTAITGSYEEVFDYGLELNNVIAIITFNVNILIPNSSTTILVRLATSDDDITYSGFTDGSSQFFPSFRYLKVRLEFTADNDKAILLLSNLTINLNVKREMDGGDVDALSTDGSGTVVTFNKAFKDIESLTVSVKSTTIPYIAIYDFTDVPNPVSFKVYVYDTSGNRVSKTVSWKARGIV